MDKTYTTVTQAEEVTEELLEMVEGVTDGWYLDKPVDWEDVWERMDGTPLNDHTLLDLGGETDTPAMRKMQRHVRKIRSQG